MARKITADELREKAKKDIERMKSKIKAIEQKENVQYGAALRKLATQANTTPEELLNIITTQVEKLSTSYEHVEPLTEAPESNID